MTSYHFCLNMFPLLELEFFCLFYCYIFFIDSQVKSFYNIINNRDTFHSQER